MEETLYEKYGGFASISRIVMAFYNRVLDSDEVGSYFDSVDMKRLIDHQTKFIAHLLGGPADYADERLEKVHAHLGITNTAFDFVVEILDETLADGGFNEDDRATVMREIERRRDKIVTIA